MFSITPEAAARLSALLQQEPDADKLGFRINRTLSGCGSHDYSISITEQNHDELSMLLGDLRFFYRESDLPFLDDLQIALNRETGRLLIRQSTAPESSSCILPNNRP
ncbi:hypothetical protein [Brevibacillus fulvus]|uniref:Fe-S cluster assembly iron-binding protein IscA n=1 Tax=Brevibacillus fulvus TaxID=1125967 RepID=A0A938XZQ4_9BACL|nr:hypothetical protein [Brevibacillus fulvus]MBM7588475.1 Fe-S cluster assembly iron-binding protein IscA [Brevibacillus fulvus]